MEDHTCPSEIMESTNNNNNENEETVETRGKQTQPDRMDFNKSKVKSKRDKPVEGYITVMGYEVRCFNCHNTGYMIVRTDIEKALGYRPNGFKTSYKSVRPFHKGVKTSSMYMEALKEALPLHEYERVADACEGFHTQKDAHIEVDRDEVRRMIQMRTRIPSKVKQEKERGNDGEDESNGTERGTTKRRPGGDNDHETTAKRKNNSKDDDRSDPRKRRKVYTPRQLRDRLRKYELEIEWISKENRFLKKRNKQLESYENVLKQRIVDLDRYKDSAFDQLMRRFAINKDD